VHGGVERIGALSIGKVHYGVFLAVIKRGYSEKRKGFVEVDLGPFEYLPDNQVLVKAIPSEIQLVIGYELGVLYGKDHVAALHV